MEPTLITAWVAFDDVDLSNGCMQVIPRSHQWGLLNVNDFFEQDLGKQRENMVLPEKEAFEPVPLRMKAGQISFHHPLTLHGSGPNQTAKPRRSIAIHMMSGETRYNGKVSHPLGVAQNHGDILDGDWFTTLYKEA
jgi:ectoine hydroxylase-related dioxygenase (phytanoyl-CoA dioxygenase family)